MTTRAQQLIAAAEQDKAEAKRLTERARLPVFSVDGDHFTAGLTGEWVTLGTQYLPAASAVAFARWLLELFEEEA